MAQGKKISELNEVSSVTDNDEFHSLTKKEVEQTQVEEKLKIKFSNLKSAIGCFNKRAKGASMIKE